MHDFSTLPAELEYLKDFGGNESAFVEQLYLIFTSDFLDSSPMCDRIRVTVSRKMGPDQKLETFWHIISKESCDRIHRPIHIPRAQKLPWVRPVLESVPQNELKYWRYYEGTGKIRRYVWAEGLAFVIVLEELKGSLRLVTAFHVDEEWKKKDLSKKYGKRL